MVCIISPAIAQGTIQEGFCSVYIGRNGPLTAFVYHNKELKKDGVLLEYHQDEQGNIERLRWYDSDVLAGKSKFYFSNKGLRKVVLYKEGRIVSVKEYDIEGKLILEEYF
jgi:antitoxin component YwqK of YwqJK toxin-antitoxin module